MQTQDTNDCASVILLDELLQGVSENGGELDLEKIKELVEKSAEMRKQHQKRAAIAEEYFKTLRERIDESSAYLEKAKKDLENINFTFTREKFKETDYDEFMNKSDEEIDAEMEVVKRQLAALEEKVERLNKNTQGAETNFNKSIKTLENISREVYDIEDI